MPKRRLPLHRQNARRTGQHKSGGDDHKPHPAYSQDGLRISHKQLIATILVLVGLFLLGFRFHAARIWRGERVSLVVQDLEADQQGSGVYLMSLLPREHSLVVLSFPEELKVDAIGGYGEWRIGSIYRLGELEGVGGILLRKSIAEFLGTHLDGWLLVPHELLPASQNPQKVLRKALVEALGRREMTNLGIYDLVRILLTTYTLEQASTRSINLADTGVLERDPDPDNTYSWRPDVALLDRLTQELLNHPEMVREDMPIAVVNSTAHRGLGKQVARTIRNMGGDVVSITDLTTDEEGSVLRIEGRQLEESETVRQLLARFDTLTLEVGSTQVYRAQAVVVVADDLWQSMNEL